MQVPGSGAAGSIVIPYDAEKKEKSFEPDESLDASQIPIEEIDIGTLSRGRQKGRKIRGKKGRYIHARIPREGEIQSDIAWDATLRAAASRRSLYDAGGAAFTVLGEDIRLKERIQNQSVLLIFLLDSSDSMSRGGAMSAAKGAILSLLTKAYQKRYKVALVSFAHDKAEILLEPTGSVSLARRKLKRLPTGGATPFADGLMNAWRIVKSERFKNPVLSPLLILISDGEANIPLNHGKMSAVEELYLIAEKIRKDKVKSLIIDTGGSRNRTGMMRCLARKMDSDYYHIDHLKSADILGYIV
ncbi:VWA domain-containing protein [Candidatus Sumerlaeota bacterium]|nr:VWA domain-containing protein [Candidatus Sumerlaeota bacterium]